MMTYTVVLVPEPEGAPISVIVPAMPGVLTWGATRDEALASAREAIELHLESYVERGLPFPSDRQRDGAQPFIIEVEPPASIS